MKKKFDFHQKNDFFSIIIDISNLKFYMKFRKRLKIIYKLLKTIYKGFKMKNILNNIQSEVLNYYNENNINKQRELGNKIINYFNVLQDCKNSLILINTK